MKMLNINDFYSRKIVTYDEAQKRIGSSSREEVHTKGLWHKGVQLNILFEDEILLQTRSSQVDISKGLIDQTIAVQMLEVDNEDEISALKRGALEELAVKLEINKIVLKSRNVRISKTYIENSTLINNEFVSLYEYNIETKNLIIDPCIKLRNFFWEKIERVKKDSIERPYKYTQTFRMWLDTVM